MSIYATLWTLKFPRYGDDFTGCDWVVVFAQGVRAHIGTPTPGHGYETGDPYAGFLPPPVALDSDPSADRMRAVVFVTADMKKGTSRSAQEYEPPLLVVSGSEYENVPFPVLHERICDALRGGRPRWIGEVDQPDGSVKVHFDDGSAIVVPTGRTEE